MARTLNTMLKWRELSVIVVAVVLAVYFQIANANFLLSNASLQNLSQFIAPVALIACGEVVLMIGGEIDLSAGMVYALTPFLMYFLTRAGLPAPLAIVGALAGAAAVGAVNGMVTVLLQVPSFVTTLGMLFLLNGLTLTLSGGTPVGVDAGPTLAFIMGRGGYAEFVWAALIVLVMHFMLRNTRWGLHTIAAGANPTGASEAGIRTRELKMVNFVISGALAGLTGILEAFRISSIDPTAGGTHIMFLAVAAAVIGGTPLAGGSGTIAGAMIGAMVLGILNDGFTLIGINAFTFDLILGGAILVAMLCNILISRYRRRMAVS
ncbi:ABC transporter permease [Gluconacetobacter azotocaptans]|uniref:ABC transporter permease n=1 Tax=Gluconacetobacter azotocaptans TaxID=142834 RepID=A0A7W4PDN1_9PROT|nr:ABC transporter permease [Gluconacetobacter azotocaptans]MBB2190422.1 ABC transporter permease [Gluconacetobacter azotocaptans]MBM9400541.1 ABC transporter permease [Gluconacetobacter azotocaptans]GBQ30188.1 ribose/xylose/arabinose/galactoside ABC transporter permease [Gluconacetobacter azotocaptans DSM 13594]